MQTYTTEEADSVQRSQKNTSTVSALLVAGILHFAVIAGFTFWYLVGPERNEPEIIMQSSTGHTQELMEKKDFSTVMKETPAPSSSQMTKVITASAAVSNVVVPEMPEMVLDTSDFGVGFGDGFGMGMGGDGQGAGGFPPPGSPLRDRCSAEDRRERLAEGGGSPATEAAVVKGLDWLKSTQSEDGSWGKGFKASMTGLALLAYLGHCETYDSNDYAENIRKGIYYLTEKALNEEGIMRSRTGHSWVYEHGIATYALCEAYSLLKYGQTKFPHMNALKEAIELSVPIIITGQNHDGGWVYDYSGSEWYKDTTGNSGERGNGDTSVTGWHMQALKAATLTGMEFKGIKRAAREGIDFLRSMQGPGGGFGYRNPGDRFSLTGVGALSQQMFRSGSHSSVRKAVDFILDHKFEFGAKDANIYGWYYGTQAVFQRGGRDWDKWNAQFRDQVVEAQSEDGSWPFEGGEGASSSKAAGGDELTYRTCLFILMLEVYYRYLPATE